MSTQVAGVLRDPFERPLGNTDIDIRAITNTFAVLPGATVKVTTSAQGEYNFILEPANYAVSVILDGRAVYQGAMTITSTTPPGTLPQLLKQAEMLSELPLNYAEYFQQVQATVKDDADRAEAAANGIGDQVDEAREYAEQSQAAAQSSQQSSQTAQQALADTQVIANKFQNLDDAVTETQQNAQQTQSDAAQTASDRAAADAAAQRAEDAAGSAETVNVRNVRVPPSETINALPAAAQRANSVAAFDGQGASTVKPLSELAQLDSSGKVPIGNIPAAALTDVFPVDSQSAMLALPADPGDVAIRSDTNKSYILMASPATTLGNWKELLNDVIKRLASASEGSSLVYNTLSVPGSINRALKDMLLEGAWHINNFTGADPTGQADSTAAFNAAFAARSASRGGIIRIDGGIYKVGNLSVPDGVTITGDTPTPWEVRPGESYYNKKSQLLCARNTSIALGRGVTIKNLTAIKTGLPPVINTNAQAATAIAAFEGVAFQSVEPDIKIENVLVLGFTYGFFSSPTVPNVGRRDFINFRGDCTNGVYANYSLDVDRLYGCHFWPYLTAHMQEATTAANNQRAGKAFYFGNISDWTELYSCFSYGYVNGIHFDNVFSVKVIGGGHDAVSGEAIKFTGECMFSYVQGVSTNGNAAGLSVATTGASHEIRSVNNTWASPNYPISVTSGGVLSTRDHLSGQGGATGAILGASGTQLVLGSPHFTGCAIPWTADASKLQNLFVSNPSYGTGQAGSTGDQIERVTKKVFMDQRVSAGGVGAIMSLGGNANAGPAELIRISAALTDGAAASMSADIYFAVKFGGAFVNRWIMKADGTLRPATDGTNPVGTGDARVGQIYSSFQNISTSDRSEKSDEGDIPEAVLDAYAEVKKKRYRLKFTPDKWDFGVIAQDMVEAFERHGLNIDDYSLISQSVIYDKPPEYDVNGNLTFEGEGRRIRYGVSYSQLAILDAAIQQRTIDALTKRLEELEK